MKRALPSFFLMILLFSGIVLVKKQLNIVRGTVPAIESMAFLPGNERIKPFMLGFNTTYAHYLWIRTVIYSGEHISGDGQFDWLIQMLDIITRLHPHFHEAYEFGGLMIPDLCNNPDAARIILERGMNVLGDRKWNIPFYLGMLYYQHYDDHERAAAYISMAAAIPSAHQRNLASLAAAFYNRAGREVDALSVLHFLYETSENPDVRRHIEAKILEFHKNESTLID
ncbi:MAG: hypothetical protein FWE57_07135 [Chitinispirillia bacterium]|nr:hypothetical protein [Chitinispirillia bacterium]